MANDVVYTFGADAAGLEAASALARANMQALTAEMRKLAKEMQATGATAESEMGQRMISLGASLTASKASLKEFSNGLKQTSDEAALAGPGIGFYAREVHALFDEFLSGRTAQLQGTIANITGTFISANTSMLPMIATGAAIAGVFAYAAYQTMSLNTAINGIEMSSAINQINLTSEASLALIESIKKAANVGNADAQKIADAFMAVGVGGNVLAQVASNYIPAYVAAGDDAVGASQKLAAVFADLSGKGRRFVDETKGMSQAEKDQYDKFVQLGDKGSAYGVILDALNIRLPQLGRNVLDSAASVARQTNAFDDLITAGYSMDEAYAIIAKDNQDLVAKADAATAAVLRQKDALLSATSAAERMGPALKEADKVDSVRSGLKEATNEMQMFAEAQKAALASGDTASAEKLGRALEIATDKAKTLGQQFDDGILGRDAVAKSQEQLQSISNNFRGSTVAMKEAQRKVLEDMLNGANLSAAQRHEIEKQVDAKNKEILDAGYQHFSAIKDMEATKAGENKAKILAIHQQEYAEAVQLYGKDSDQAISAMNRVITARNMLDTANKNAAHERLRVAMDSAQQEVSAQENATKEKIVQIDALAKRHQITEREKLAETIAALKEGLNAEIAILEEEKKLNGMKPMELAKVLDQEKKLHQQYALDVIRIQEQVATAIEQKQEKMFSSFNGAVTGQISGLLDGTKSIGSALASVLATVTTDVLKFYVNWGLKAAENKVMQLADISAVTAAQTTSDAIKTSSALSADAAKNASGLAAILKSIGASAAETFAGVFGFFSPVMGPAAAGPAAASQATVMSAASGIASFDIGAWSLRRSGLANVHENEMIVPAAHTPWVQDLISNAKAPGGQGASAPAQSGPSGDIHLHVHALDAKSFVGYIKDNGADLTKIVSDTLKRTPSLRGGY